MCVLGGKQLIPQLAVADDDEAHVTVLGDRTGDAQEPIHTFDRDEPRDQGYDPLVRGDAEFGAHRGPLLLAPGVIEERPQIETEWHHHEALRLGDPEAQQVVADLL